MVPGRAPLSRHTTGQVQRDLRLPRNTGLRSEILISVFNAQERSRTSKGLPPLGPPPAVSDEFICLVLEGRLELPSSCEH